MIAELDYARRLLAAIITTFFLKNSSKHAQATKEEDMEASQAPRVRRRLHHDDASYRFPRTRLSLATSVMQQSTCEDALREEAQAREDAAEDAAPSAEGDFEAEVR